MAVDFAELGIGTETSGLKKGQTELDKLTVTGQRTEKKVTASTEAMSAGFKRLGGIAVAALGAIGVAAGLRETIGTLGDFGASMAKVAAITRATGADLVALRETAKELGSSTEFSAGQAADGLAFLGMAGLSAAESMAAIPAILDLATASGEGLAFVADKASNILSAFGLEAAEAARVADVLAAASSRSNTSVSQLASAMTTIAPLSKSLGITLEETSAALGVLADNGLQGERAGTGLRGVFASLVNPVDAARDALSNYGLAASDVDIASRKMSDVLETLRKANISAADNITIFGLEAATAATVLVAGAARVNEFGVELTKVDGEAQKMAATMRDQLNGDVKSLGSAIEGLVIAFGDAGLTGVLRRSVQGMTDLVRTLTGIVQPAAERFVSYIGAAAVIGVVAFQGAIGAATAAMLLFVRSILLTRVALIRTGWGIFIVLAGEAAYQISLVAESVGGLGTAFGLFGDAAAGVWEGIGKSAEAIVPVLGAVWETAKSDFFRFLEVMQSAWATWLHNAAAVARSLPFADETALALGNAAIMAGSLTHEYALSADQATAASAKLLGQAGLLATNGFDKASEALSVLKAFLVSVPGDADAAGAAATRLSGALAGIGGITAGGGTTGDKKKKDDKADPFEDITPQLVNLSKVKTELEQTAESVDTAFGTLFKNIATAPDQASQALERFRQSVTSLLLDNAFKALFQGGADGKGGGIFSKIISGIGSILGSAIGGGGGSNAEIFSGFDGLNTSTLPSIGGGGSLGGSSVFGSADLFGPFGGARANGGDVRVGRSYMVGERGVERFTPTENGVISPNGAGGGVNVDFQVINNVPGASVSQSRSTGPDGRALIIATVNKAGSRGELTGMTGRYALSPTVRQR